MIRMIAVLSILLAAATVITRAADPAAPAASQPTTQRVTASGLTIIEVDVPSGETTARNGDIVLVHYTGKLADGTQFDSSASRPPLQLTLGKGQVIKGWDEGLVGMKIGQSRKLVIPPALGYGAQGQGESIPPNSTLYFDVQLVGIVRLP